MESPSVQGLRARVKDILMSSECQKISFSLDGTSINGSGYSYVALALVSKPTTLGGMKFNTSKITGGAEAQYDQFANALCFPKENYGQTDFEKMSIVHECTHALIDAMKKKTLMITNEMCAYIAGSAYNNNRGAPFIPSLEDKIFVEAGKVATYMTTTSEKWHYTQSFALSGSDVAELRQSILGTKLYAFIKKNPKGSYGENGLRL